jgi:hypothetical protein
MENISVTKTKKRQGYMRLFIGEDLNLDFAS